MIGVVSILKQADQQPVSPRLGFSSGLGSMGSSISGGFKSMFGGRHPFTSHQNYGKNLVNQNMNDPQGKPMGLVDGAKNFFTEPWNNRPVLPAAQSYTDSYNSWKSDMAKFKPQYDAQNHLTNEADMPRLGGLNPNRVDQSGLAQPPTLSQLDRFERSTAEPWQKVHDRTFGNDAIRGGMNQELANKSYGLANVDAQGHSHINPANFQLKNFATDHPWITGGIAAGIPLLLYSLLSGGGRSQEAQPININVGGQPNRGDSSMFFNK